MQNHEEYLRGQADCKHGVPHKPGQGADYNNGYSDQHFIEQSLTEANRRSDREFRTTHKAASH